MNATQAAEILYTVYCASVGGTAFNGDPLPDWRTFRADPAKAKQASAWEAAASQLLIDIQLQGIPAQFNTMNVLSQAEMLCNGIEALPASEQQTALSVKAAELRKQISDLIT